MGSFCRFFYFSVTTRPVKMFGSFPIHDYLFFIDRHISPLVLSANRDEGAKTFDLVVILCRHETENPYACGV